MDFLKPYSNSVPILTICAVLCAFSLILLNNDLRVVRTGEESNQLGKVLNANFSVKRKNQKSLLWNPITDNSTLFLRDSILVGPKSNASFELSSGEKIELGEDSFFVVEPGINIKQQLKRGALIYSQNGERTQLESQEDGTVKEKKLEALLEHPDNNAQIVILDNDVESVEFKWTASKKSSETILPVLQVATNKQFAGDFILPKAGQYALPVGDYYWRIVDKGEVISEIRTFSITKLSPLTLVRPAQNENIARIDFILPLSFNWRPLKKKLLNNRVDLIQIAEDKEFNTNLFEKEISPVTGFTEIKNLKAGTYHWRILSKTANEKIVESETRTFHLSQVENISLSLISPENNFFIRRPEEILFQWKENEIELEYFLEVVQSNNKEPVFSQSSKGVTVIWRNPKAGNFLWRVSAKNALKTVSSSSWNTMGLIDSTPLSLTAPKEFESHIFWEKPPIVMFTWEKISNAESYMIEFSDSSSFKKIFASQNIMEPEISSESLKLQRGKLYWRVRAIDSEQNTLNLSKAREFTFDNPPPLRAPHNLSPPDGTTWDVIKEGKELVVKWDAVPEAKSYEVNVSGNSIGTFNTVVDSPQIILQRYKSGKYRVSISAIDVLGRTGSPLGPIHLNLSYSSLKAPAVEEPEIK